MPVWLLMKINLIASVHELPRWTRPNLECFPGCDGKFLQLVSADTNRKIQKGKAQSHSATDRTSISSHHRTDLEIVPVDLQSNTRVTCKKDHPYLVKAGTNPPQSFNPQGMVSKQSLMSHMSQMVPNGPKWHPNDIQMTTCSICQAFRTPSKVQPTYCLVLPTIQ